MKPESQALRPKGSYVADILRGSSLMADQAGLVYDFVHGELKRTVFKEFSFVAQPLPFGRNPSFGFDLELQKVDCVIGISPEPEIFLLANEDIEYNTFRWDIFTIG